MASSRRKIKRLLVWLIPILGGIGVGNWQASLQAHGFVYQSNVRLLGMPLIDVKFLTEAQLRVLERRGLVAGMEAVTAKGWIAIGMCAVGGLVSFGVVSVAPVAVGVGAFGLYAAGVLAVGLFVGDGVCGLGGYLGRGVMGLGLVKSSSFGVSSMDGCSSRAPTGIPGVTQEPFRSPDDDGSSWPDGPDRRAP